jgi:hypothetical protein
MSGRSPKKRPQKHQLHRGKDGGRLWKAAVVLVAIGVVCASLAAGLLLSGLTTSGPSGPKMAAIVDQLSLTFPNPAFAETATNTLEEAGYAVDYYSGEAVTVDLYRDLPKHDYELIILRVHSGIVRQIDPTSEEKTVTEYVGLFTGEPYSDARYGGREATGRIGLAVARDYHGGQYFGVTPYFIELTMEGRFDRPTIILMGCDGLRSDRTAEAFIEKGAGSFVSWTGKVSASHTDAATERLLQHLLVEKLPTPEAVEQTMAEVGPDPEYDSILLVYPSEG